MSSRLRFVLPALLIVAAFACAPSAFARSHWNVGVNFGFPGVSIGYSDYGHRGHGWGGNYYGGYYAPVRYRPVYYGPSYHAAAYYGPGYYGYGGSYYYYYSRHNRYRPLPAYRVTFDDAESTGSTWTGLRVLSSCASRRRHACSAGSTTGCTAPTLRSCCAAADCGTGS